MDQKTPRQCNVKRLRRETCSTPLGLAKCQKRNPPFPTFARLSSHQNIDTGPFACPLRNLKNYCRSNGRMSKQSLIERSGQTPNYQPDWRSVCVFGFGWDHQLAYTKHRYPCETFSFHCEQLRLNLLNGAWLSSFLAVILIRTPRLTHHCWWASPQHKKKHVKTTFPTAWQWVQYLNIAYLHAVRDIFFQPKSFNWWLNGRWLLFQADRHHEWFNTIHFVFLTLVNT